MFEGKPPLPPQASADAREENLAGELHALSWSDLVAKLAAARDLRSEIVIVDDASPASFDAESARRLASLTERPEGDGKQAVNPLALGNGKGARCSDGVRNIRNDQADRGN